MPSPAGRWPGWDWLYQHVGGLGDSGCTLVLGSLSPVYLFPGLLEIVVYFPLLLHSTWGWILFKNFILIGHNGVLIRA